jgi:exopolysaccharide biosynthesis polyprenyl glycosylphosphotransferase
MTSLLERAHSIPTPSEHAALSASKNHALLPQYRYVIKVTVILIAVVGDILLIGFAALTAGLIRFQSLSESHTGDLLVVIVPTFVLAAVALKCYRLNTLRRFFRSVERALFALAIAAGLAFTTAFALQAGALYSRIETGLTLIVAAAYLTLGHVLYKATLDCLRGFIEPRVLMLGPAFAKSDIAVDVDRVFPVAPPNSADPGSLEKAYAQIRHADRLMLAFDDPAERAAWVQFVRMIGIEAELMEPNLQNITVLGVSNWNGTPTLVVARGPLNFTERAIKRVFDLAISLPLLGLAGPWLLLLMILIKLDSSGPAIFAQPRVGRNNCRYQCYKLRTMFDDMGDPLGNRSTGRDDDRVTRIGKFLRRTSLDELPQLWNVIRGDMSLVGPRPHALGSTAEGAMFWEAVPDYWTRHSVRPGITGLAQVRGLRGATISRNDIEKRVAADFEYINSWSIWLDLKILLQTIRVLLHRNSF